MNKVVDIDNVPSEILNIPAQKLRLAERGELHDEKFETKPIGYFRDAWIRFRKNRSSVVAAMIILAIILFALIVPLISPYDVSFSVTTYSKKLPRTKLLSKIGIFDGTKVRERNDNAYAYTVGIGVGAADTDGTGATWEEGLAHELSPAKRIIREYEREGKRYRDIAIDVYLEVGFRYYSVTDEEYEKIRAWENETGIQVLYPMVDTHSEFCYDPLDANYWYKTKPGRMEPIKETDFSYREIDIDTEQLEPNYLYDKDGNVRFYQNIGTNMKKIRVLYYNYYRYLYGFEPYHLFGTDASGYDICVRLADGVRLSIMLAVFVSAINFVIGGVYGAIEGYFGGTADLIMERIADILYNMPFMVVVTLFQLHFANKVGPIMSLLFAFVTTGWIGTASRIRMQFYRFKNSEYVYAARTLGASDARLMLRHIFPNSLGTIITSSVMVIPGVIYSETMLSFLGIISLQGDKGTSLGTMISNAQASLTQFPHMMFFPALIISLLMISFNLFGNGLRDAFNPSLRGVED
ncbi:MAG: ABC transporter permease [Eubacteriales bacterium]|jgi:oligopeptide transport system permease protein|nr:ABC transporter permease [Clostridiales bacterium]